MLHTPQRPRRGPSPWLWILGIGGLLTGGLVGLVLAGTPLLARIELQRSIQDLARASGFEITVDRVSIDLRGSLVLDGIRAEDWQGTGIQLAASKLRTRIHAGALLRGVSRTADLDIDGLRVTLGRADTLEAGIGWSTMTRLGRLARAPLLAGRWRVAFEGAIVQGLDENGAVAWTAGPVRALIGRPSSGHSAGGELVATVTLPEGPAQITAALSLDEAPAGRLQVTADRELPIGPLPGVFSRGFAARLDTLQLDRARIDTRVGDVAVAGVARAIILRSRHGSIPRRITDVGAIAVHGLDADVSVPGPLGPWLLTAAAGQGLPSGPLPDRVDLADASLRVAEATSAARLTLDGLTASASEDAPLSGTAHAELTGLEFDAPWLSARRLELPTVAGSARFQWRDEAGGRHLSLVDATVGPLSVALDVRSEPGAAWSATLGIPEQPCGALAGALPGGLVSVLRSGAAPIAAGQVAAAVSVRVPGAGGRAADLAVDGHFDCVPAELEPDAERRVESVVKAARTRDRDEPAALRRWVVALLAPREGANPAHLLRDPVTLLSPDADPAALDVRESPLERAVASALPPRDGTIGGRLSSSWAALRLATLLDPDEIALMLADELRIGDARGLGGAASLIGKRPSELTALDVAYLVVASQEPAPPPLGAPLDEGLRHRVAARMQELMLMGAITPADFVAAAPYDPFSGPR